MISRPCRHSMVGTCPVCPLSTSHDSRTYACQQQPGLTVSAPVKLDFRWIWRQTICVAAMILIPLV